MSGEAGGVGVLLGEGASETLAGGSQPARTARIFPASELLAPRLALAHTASPVAGLGALTGVPLAGLL